MDDRLYSVDKHWYNKAAEWQQKYEDLHKTFYQQWARHQKQHDERMKQLEEEYAYESDYIQKLEDENKHWHSESAEWQKKYDELHKTFYQQWVRNKKEYEERMKQLEEENEQLRLQDESKYWRMKSAEWQKRYEVLHKIFYGSEFEEWSE